MGAPEFGNPLGNPLSRPSSAGAVASINPQTYYFKGSYTDAVSGVFEIPAGFSFARVTAIGGGGGGSGSNSNFGGGGGGLARTSVQRVNTGEKISYSITAGSQRGTAGGNASATFKNYSLVATGGAAAADGTTPKPGGVGSGGDVNNNGGLGRTGGGGCAGITGPGGDGSLSVGTTTYYSGDGGAGGAAGSAGGGGGGGLGQAGGDATYLSTNPSFSEQLSMPGPTAGTSVGVNTNGERSKGGDFGGGGGAYNGTAGQQGYGGVGGVIIELW